MRVPSSGKRNVTAAGAGLGCLSVQQVLMKRLRQQQRRTGVGAQVRHQAVVAEAGDAVMLEHGGVVDHGIDGAEALDHMRQQGPRLGLITQIGLETTHQGGRRRTLAAVGHGLRGVPRRVAVMHRHLPAGGGQRQRGLTAQPLGGAGDQHGAKAGRGAHSGTIRA